MALSALALPPLVAETRRAHTTWLTALAFSADGAKLVSGSIDGAVAAWRLVPWSRETHRLFGDAARAQVVQLLWLNTRWRVRLPDELLDLVIRARLAA